MARKNEIISLLRAGARIAKAIDRENRRQARVAAQRLRAEEHEQRRLAREYEARQREQERLAKRQEKELIQAFLQAGLRLHFAGHMHVNDTGIWEGKEGKHLYNIQVPSIATYVPAYKILTIESDEVFRVETVTLDTVPRFDSLFPLYRAECQSDSLRGHSPVWNKEILSARTYGEFCDYQFRDLVRLRFIPRDLPESWRACLDFTGAQMLKAVSGKDKSEDTDWTDWCMKDLVLDLYRLRYAERLALKDIPETRLAAYRYLFDRTRISPLRSTEVEMVNGLGTLFLAFLNGEPCQNFVIDLEKDTITGY